MKKVGTLLYNHFEERYGVSFVDDLTSSLLLLDEPFEVLEGSIWVETSLGYNERHYYTNSQIQLIEGQIVRV